MKSCWTSVLFTCFLFVAASGQTERDEGERPRVKYSLEFEFNEGVFLNFDAFKNNNPLSKDEIISTISRDDPYFFKKLFNTRSFRFFDENGDMINIFTEDVFGVSVNGEPFINFRGRFRKIMVLGMLSYFAPGAGDPDIQPRFGIPDGENNAFPETSGEGFKQILFHFETGEFTNLTPEAVADFISDAPSLHREFMQLKRKEQRTAMYAFIRRYNQANPIYIPQ